MKLEISGIAVDCIIGDLKREREVPQRVNVDVALEVDDGAALSDRLGDAVDYVGVADDVRGVLQAARCRLIERAAYLAAERVRTRPHVRSATVRVTKAGAVPGIAAAVAEYSA